jgi:anthranilate synthase component 1
MAHGGRLHLQAGAGIVAQSDPLREREEVRQKLMALFEAIRAAKEMER